MKTHEARIRRLEQRHHPVDTDVRTLPDRRLRQIVRQGIRALEAKETLTPEEMRALAFYREALVPGMVKGV